MVEVFKTDVEDQSHAAMLVDLIQEAFAGYKANFDLEDCDRILRIEARNGDVEACRVTDLLAACGYSAEVLPDTEEVAGEYIRYHPGF